MFFLVDVTTPYDQGDKNVIVRMANEILASLKGGEKLVIRTIGDSHARSERLLERCVPYCFETSWWGRFFVCSDGAIRTDKDKVQSEIIDILRKRLANFEELPRSDILRTIHTSVMEEAIPSDRIVLYIYSDLIENSDYFASSYLFNYTLERLLHGVAVYKLFAPLKGAEVFVAGVGRAGTADRRPLSVKELNKLKEFWDAYFKQSGARQNAISQDFMPSAPR